MSNFKKTLPQVIVALDHLDSKSALSLVDQISSVGIQWFKVGLELYSQTGPAFILELKKRGLNVFVDLKLYDIPNTVAQTVKVIESTGADFLTIHINGGREMLCAAFSAVQHSSLKLLGVTLLTSFSETDLNELNEKWNSPLVLTKQNKIDRHQAAADLASLAFDCGLSGIVCSVPDLNSQPFQSVKEKYKQKLFITPGIRNSTHQKNDQKSIATISSAISSGSTHLVIGRPITAPENQSPTLAAQEILEQIKRGSNVI